MTRTQKQLLVKKILPGERNKQNKATHLPLLPFNKSISSWIIPSRANAVAHSSPNDTVPIRITTSRTRSSSATPETRRAKHTYRDLYRLKQIEITSKFSYTITFKTLERLLNSWFVLNVFNISRTGGWKLGKRFNAISSSERSSSSSSYYF